MFAEAFVHTYRPSLHSLNRHNTYRFISFLFFCVPRSRQNTLAPSQRKTSNGSLPPHSSRMAQLFASICLSDFGCNYSSNNFLRKSFVIRANSNRWNDFLLAFIVSELDAIRRQDKWLCQVVQFGAKHLPLATFHLIFFFSPANTFLCSFHLQTFFVQCFSAVDNCVNVVNNVVYHFQSNFSLLSRNEDTQFSPTLSPARK